MRAKPAGGCYQRRADVGCANDPHFACAHSLMKRFIYGKLFSHKRQAQMHKGAQCQETIMR
jgi:hypothetical protein